MPRRDDVRELRERRAHVHAEMLALSEKAQSENRDLTAEEEEQYGKMAEDMVSLEKRARRMEQEIVEQDNVQRDLTVPMEARVSPEDVPETFAEFQERRTAQKPWNTPEFRSAWYRWLISPSPANELEVEEKRVLSKASAGAGLNLVPTEFERQIINIARHMGPINELATTFTTSSGEAIQLPGVSAHGVAAWIAESGAFSPSDETFTQVTMNAYKAGTKVIVSEELLQDSAFGLDSYLTQEFGERVGVLEETAFAVGDGSGKPLGIAHASSGVTVSQAATGNATAFTYDALVAFKFAIPYQYRRDLVWVLHDSAVRNLYTLKDTTNMPIWAPNIAGNGPDTLLGLPIYTSPDLAAPAASAKSGIIGNIRRGYRIRRVDGFAMQRQNELHSDNGQIGFRGFTRVDGRVVLADAMRVLQHSAT